MIVSIAAYKRPDYMRDALVGLARAADELHHETGELTYIVASIDPSDQLEKVKALFSNERGTWVYVNEEQKGCSGNTLLALDRAFDIASRLREDYVQHLEEDFVFAPDALLLSAWIRDTYRDDPTVIAGGVQTAHAATPDEYMRVQKSAWFHCQGWSTWADRWELLLKPSWQVPLGGVALGGWAQQFNDRAFHGEHWLPASWDTHLDLVAFNGLGKGAAERTDVPRFQVIPRLSRCKHIGLEGGVHTTPETFARDLPKVYAADVELPDGPYVPGKGAEPCASL